jgi:hypothetical protein
MLVQVAACHKESTEGPLGVVVPVEGRLLAKVAPMFGEEGLAMAWQTGRKHRSCVWAAADHRSIVT